MHVKGMALLASQCKRAVGSTILVKDDSGPLDSLLTVT